MTDYNVIGEVAATLTTARADDWMVELADHSPAFGTTHRGGTEIVLTIPAKTIGQAISLGSALLRDAVGELTRFEVLTTAEFDRRTDDVQMPELVGATEAAEIIGVARQRVQQLAATGQIPSQTVGKSLVFPRSTVEAIARARAEGRTVDG